MAKLRKAKIKRPARDASWDDCTHDGREVREEITALIGADRKVDQFVSDLSEYFDCTSAVLILRAAKKNGLIR